MAAEQKKEGPCCEKEKEKEKEKKEKKFKNCCRGDRFLEANPVPVSSAIITEVWKQYDPQDTGLISESQARVFLTDLAKKENVVLDEGSLTGLLSHWSQDDKFTFVMFKKFVAEWAAMNAVDMSQSMQAEVEVQSQKDQDFTGARISGFRRFDWNGDWVRDKKRETHDGKPVYVVHPFRRHFYLYYRQKGSMWVIDEQVVASGPYFAFCLGDSLKNGEWSVVCGWTVCNEIKSQMKEEEGGKETITISGALDEGCNGVYERLPESENVARKPHYYLAKEGKEKGEKEERHIIFSAREALWQICPIASDRGGAFGIARELKGPWMIIPDDKKVDGVQILTFENGKEVE